MKHFPKMRSYGWVQNPSDFNKLKLTVQIFDPSSQHYAALRDKLVPELICIPDVKKELIALLKANSNTFTYSQLVGFSRQADGKAAKSRKNAVADGLIQVTILPQSTSKRWTDNWTANGFLSWALSLGFLRHNRRTDSVTITSLGQKFSSSTVAPDKDQILHNAILSYPPAIRIIQLLHDSAEPKSKFQIGSQLGFKGEKGFTSYPHDLMQDYLKQANTSDERRHVRSDVEGTADKYARMIAKWLEKLGYVKIVRTSEHGTQSKYSGFPQFRLTAQGMQAHTRLFGLSKHTRPIRFLKWEFLATDGAGKNTRRTRRALLLQLLTKSQSLDRIMHELNNEGFDISKKTVLSDLAGLNNIGIEIQFDTSRALLKDHIIGIDIPEYGITRELADKFASEKQNRIIEKTNLPEQYYELYDIAHDGKRNRDFEILTIDILTSVYGFKGMVMGGGRKPDGIVYSISENFGIIIDTKAYSGGYGKSIAQEDEMTRYINDNLRRDEERNPTCWWDNFPSSIPRENIYFLWVSSTFKPGFKEQLQSTSRNTGILGGALSVESLLLGADLVQKKKLSLASIRDKIRNEEILFSN